MTKEDMILYAEFMAGYDINQTPMAGLDIDDLVADDASEVWSDCLIIEHDGKEVGIIPNKTKSELKIRTFIKNEYNELRDYDWTPTDEELVAELKKQGYCAPWVGAGALKHIIVRKWPEVLDGNFCK